QAQHPGRRASSARPHGCIMNPDLCELAPLGTGRSRVSCGAMSAVVTTSPTTSQRPLGRGETAVVTAGATDPGRVRSVNQDYFFDGRIAPYGYLAVVADGMGGHISGEVASRGAVEAFTDCLRRTRAHAPVALARAAQAANVQVYNRAIEKPQP